MTNVSAKGMGGNFIVESNPQAEKQTGKAPVPGDVPGFVVAVGYALAAGAGVLLTHTRDGGALAITILDGSEKLKTYCSSKEQLSEAALAIRRRYKSDTPPSNGNATD